MNHGKKRLSRHYTLLVLVMLMLSLAISCKVKEDDKEEPDKVKKWTFMFYIAADASNTADTLLSIGPHMYSGENLNVIILHDAIGAPADLWYVNENKETVMKKNMGEINQGDSQTLRDFVNLAKTEYPAERYLIGFYSHGGAWLGVSSDLTNDDYLSPDDIAKGLEESGGVDLVCFTAPCVMGAFEMAYEIRNCAEVMVASEANSGLMAWYSPLRELRDVLNHQSDTDNITVGKHIIEFMRAQQLDWVNKLTMSAIQLDKTPALADALDQMSTYYLQNLADFQLNMAAVAENVKRYSFQVDIFDLAEKLAAVETKTEGLTILERVKKMLKESVIDEFHGNLMTGTNGLSIFLPTLKYSFWLPEYHSDDYGLDSSRDTKWDELMTAYVNLLDTGETADGGKQ